MAINVGMVSLGCPKNQMDAELMLASLYEAGMEITPDSGLADVVVVNTCGFIEDAKKEAIENILEFAALKKEGRIRDIVVTGCMAQRYGQMVADELPECNAVLGLGANRDIVAAVKTAYDGGSMQSFPSLDSWVLDGKRIQSTPHYFAYLRIADGCDNRCTYCAIPLIRGGLRSRKQENIIAEAKALAAAGVKEIVVIAQDPIVYGEDIYGERRLPALLKELCRIDGIAWIRLLYCYPEHITDELLTVMASEPKIVKYLDMPIQHASGNVLRAMNRKTDKETLTALIDHIHKTVKGITLRTTVMVGFPGETAEDFEQLSQFVGDVKFDRLGCFTYSPEEGTPAATLPDQIPAKVKQKRCDHIMEKQAHIVDALQEALIGKTVRVLVEGYDRLAESWFGRSAAHAPEIDGNIFFSVPQGACLATGDFVNVTITDRLDWDLIGEMCDECTE